MRPLHECSDEELLARVVANRDQEAFTALIKRYEAMMLRVSLRVLHQRQEAEDACQIAFLVLWKKAELIRDGQKLRHWLCCVTRREALRICAGKHQREPHDGLPDGGLIAQIAPPPDEMAKRERLAIVNVELRFLPEKYRTPLVLCYLEGMNKAEIAAELGLPEGTVSTWLARGRERLRRRLTRRGIVSAS